MGMTVDQPRRDPAALAVGSLPGIEAGWRVGGGPCIDDPAMGGGDHTVIDETKTLAGRRKRCKTAAVPDVIDRCHEPFGPLLTFERLACRQFVYTYSSRTCPEVRGLRRYEG
jgi:hypothetical protein